jgi:hypothetical protein
MTSQVFWRRRAQFAPRHVSVALAREFVGAELDAHDLSYLVDRVELVVNELVSDAVEPTDSAIDVSVEELLFCLRLTVRSHPSCPTPTVRCTDAGGRGSSILDRVSAGWGVGTAHHGDTSVWALFALRAPSYEAWLDRRR